jgi:single-stranded-DNA-specific exonuclease
MLNEKSLINAVITYNNLSQNQIDELNNPTKFSISNHPLFLEAEQIILDAIEKNKKIIICGDYDADGICSTTILYRTLKSMKARVGYYIPNRFNEGYGLNDNTVDLALGKGYELFILVDNGVSALSSLQKIRDAHASCIILDHHSYEGEVLCDCLVHPNLLDEFYKDMCGSGLAYNLSERLIGYDAYNVSLAGIATIADLMPLWGFNRMCVKQSLNEINNNQASVLMNLLNSKGRINETDLAFQLVPKLNAIGRLADLINVNKVVEYLCLENGSEIDAFSKEIIRINDLRKEINQKMYIKALDRIDSSRVLVLFDTDFHEGIVGITAGRLASELKRPVFVLNQEGTRLKGSARSYGSIDLRRLVEPASHLLIRFGGHAQAAGLELDVSNIDEFKRLINQNEEALVQHKSVINYLEMRDEWLTVDSFIELNLFGPFGQGFQIPSFKFTDFNILSNRIIRGGISFDLSFQNITISAVYFQNTLDERLVQSNFSSIIGRITVDDYRNQRKLKIMIESFE